MEMYLSRNSGIRGPVKTVTVMGGQMTMTSVQDSMTVWIRISMAFLMDATL